MPRGANKIKFTGTPNCYVEDCRADACFEVFLHDEYVDGVVFHEQDFTCPFLCATHKDENERAAKGIRGPRQVVDYPHTNKHRALGWSVYVPLPTRT